MEILARLFIVITLLFKVNAFVLLNEQDQTAEELSRIAIHVAKKYCSDCLFIRFVTQNETLSRRLLDRILWKCEENFIPVLVHGYSPQESANNESDIIHKNTPILFLILSSRSSDIVSYLISQLIQLTVWNPRARILIIFISNIDLADTKWMTEVFQSMWKNHALYVDAVFWNSNTSGINIYTYNPFTTQFLQNYTDFAYTGDIFTEKLLDLNQHNLTTAITPEGYVIQKLFTVASSNGTIRYQGMDAKVMFTIANKLNAHLNIIPKLKLQEIFEKMASSDIFETTKILKTIVEEYNIDVLFQGRPLDFHPFEFFMDRLYPHMKDKFCVVVPRGKKINQIYYLFMVFDNRIWYSLLVFISIGVIISYLISAARTTLYKAKKQSVVLIFLDIFRLTTGGPIHFPTYHMSGRIMVVLWAVFGLWMTNIFTCSLIKTLLSSKYEPDIMSLAELEKSGKIIHGTFLGTSYSIDILSKLNYSKEFLDRFRSVNTINPLWFFPYLKNSEAFTVNTHRVHRLLKNDLFRTNKEGRKQFMILPECLTSYWYAYYVSRDRGIVYLDRLNDLVSRIYTSGLPMFWDKNAVKLNLGRLHRAQQEEENIPISMKHIQAAFFILSVGLLTSLIIFILEHLYSKLITKKLYSNSFLQK